MKKTKKIFFAFCLEFFVLVASLVSQTLPNGMSAAILKAKKEGDVVTEVTLARPLLFPTKYGEVTIAQEKTIGFYKTGELSYITFDDILTLKTDFGDIPCRDVIYFWQNGNLKKCFIEETAKIKTDVGEIVATSTKPAKKKSYWDIEYNTNKQQPEYIPLEFYENEKVSQAYLSTQTDDLLTKQGKISPKGNNFIYFWQNGNVKSFVTTAALPECVSSVFPGQYLQIEANTEVAFFEDGRLHTFTLHNTMPLPEYDTTISGEIEVSDTGKVLSAIVQKEAITQVGDTWCKILPGYPIGFWENGKVKGAAFDLTDNHIIQGDIQILCDAQEGDKVEQGTFSYKEPSISVTGGDDTSNLKSIVLLTFFEDGKIQGVACVPQNASNFYGVEDYKRKPFVVKVKDKAYSAVVADFFENMDLSCITFWQNNNILLSKTQGISIWKMFYSPNKTTAVAFAKIANDANLEKKWSYKQQELFYGLETSLVIYENGKIKKTVALEGFPQDVTFDEAGKPVSCTVEIDTYKESIIKEQKIN